MKTNFSITGLLKYCVYMFAIIPFTSCNDTDNQDISDFTGNEVVYQLHSASDYNISGTITFKERKDGYIQAETKLINTQHGGVHPLHLHYEALGKDGNLAALLEPVQGGNGKSTTLFKVLGDESTLTYTDLIQFDGSVKIHLDDGDNKDIVLAGGNIGNNRLDDTNIISCTDFSTDL